MEELRQLGVNIVQLCDRVSGLEDALTMKTLEAAHYKALFYHKSDLARRLADQIRENHDAMTGAWDGFCYSSARLKAVFRDLHDMHESGMIDAEELAFCE